MSANTTEWITRLFEDPDLLRMGHCQRPEDLNLGMGWLYYAVARLVRPETVVVIGSWRGFAPLIYARALADNVEDGKVIFIDPSLVDDFWKAPQQVRDHFARFDITNVEHYLMTTQEFVETDGYRSLGEVGIVFIDGYHSEEQARFDFEAFEPLVPGSGLILMHDSIQRRSSKLYGPDRVYEYSVKDFVDQLKSREDLQVFDLPFANGLTLVRKSIEAR
ncbi:MAG: class I SAM-dependent methyltransferase [Planctomycetes bacterium]|nr:class I SAM-dependent methyltransferase [Planctomycetota bacterium]